MRNLARIALSAAALPLVFGATVSLADPVLPDSTELRKYLVIGTGDGTQGDEFRAFQQSDTEIGADQEVVSTSDNGTPTQRTGSLPSGSSPNLRSVFDQRWNNEDPNHPNDTVGIPDTLTGARPIFEGIDYSGNVAITGARANFDSSNSDVNANIGIQCNRTSGCFPNPSSDNSYFSGAPGDPEANLNTGNGISQFDPTALNNELSNWQSFVEGLQADTTFTNNIENENFKDGSGPFVTDLDAIDLAGNNDGIAVIDVDRGNNDEFLVNNSDWILETAKDTLVIFRSVDGTNFNFSNSSIVTGGGDDDSEVIDELGAIFVVDELGGTNEMFNLSNVILGGIALWDLIDFNPDIDPQTGDRTVINLQNAQGCAQFISHQVLMSNNRWNRCALGEPTTQVSEPGTLALLGLGLGGLVFMRRRRKLAA